MSDTLLNASGKLTASVKVKNIGSFDGEEVVQLYIQDVVGSVTRPVKELKNYQKVFISKGEEVEVKFEISAEELAFYNNDLTFKSEAGDFNLFIGTNSRDVKSASFILTKEP